jgi:hypothetical protein
MRTWIVEVMIPPTIGAAIGIITSDPIPASQRIGARLASTACNRHEFRLEALHRSLDGRGLDVLRT